jgi:hypothetical protein
MLTGFPALYFTRIDAQALGHLPLRQAEPSTRGGKALRDGDGGRLWVVPQELDDGREVADGWTGCVAFPVGDRGFINADLIGNLLLEEFEVEAVGANLVA